MALVPLRPAGRRCALRLSRASGLPGGRRVLAASTLPSWMRGASCTGTVSRPLATTRTWTSWRS
eukprot:367909-Alexandrium_andersonii.AAC.1